MQEISQTFTQVIFYKVTLTSTKVIFWRDICTFTLVWLSGTSLLHPALVVSPENLQVWVWL